MIDYARADKARTDAALKVIDHGFTAEQATKVAKRAWDEVMSDERNGSLNPGAGRLVIYGDGRLGLYTYAGRVIDPLAEYSIDTCSTLD